MGFVKTYLQVIDQIKIGIIILCLVLIGVGGYFVPQLLTRTSSFFDPPPNSPAALANSKLSVYFPELVSSSNLAIYIYSNANTTVLGDALKNFTFDIKKAAMEYPGCGDCIAQYQGYYTTIDLSSLIANGFMDPRNTSSLIEIIASYSFASSEAVDFCSFLNDKIQQLTPPGVSWSAELTGIPAFIPFMQASVERDWILMDGIVLPIAVIILIILLQSARLLLITLFCILASAGISFLIVFGLSFKIQIISFAPSLMMSILIAMSIDYQLFLLSRYREELIEGEKSNALAVMIRSGGHTIGVSGITLACCFAGLCILPLDMMISLGISCCMTVIITLIVNLTLTPSLILLFPTFFEGSINPIICCGKSYFGAQKPIERVNDTINTSQQEYQDEASHLTSSTKYTTNLMDQYLLNYRNRIVKKSPIWYKIGSKSTDLPWNIILIVFIVGITVPVSLYSFHYQTTDSLMMALPNDASITYTYEKMLTTFGETRLYPYCMLLTPQNYPPVEKYNKTLGPVFNDNFIKNVSWAISEMVSNLPNTSKSNFQGFVYADSIPMNSYFIDLCILNQTKLPLCNLIRYGSSIFVSDNQEATYMFIQLDFEALGAKGDTWYREAVPLLESLSSKTNIDITLTGIPATAMDAIDSANNSFLTMILVTGALVLLGVGLSFRSILVPLRSVVSITLTLLWVFGLADLVYEHHLLDFLGFFGLKGWDALHWAPPLVSFSIVVGIALDYDIFLLVRIFEFRDMGYSTKEAIALGVASTGHIITAAGLIMAIAFSGLLFSSVAVANMLAFYMVFSVLYDTFLVRPLLVPSLMSLLGDLNWFPRRLPPAIFSSNDILFFFWS